MNLVLMSFYRMIFDPKIWRTACFYTLILYLLVWGLHALGAMPVGELSLPVSGFFKRPQAWTNMTIFGRIGNFTLAFLAIWVIASDYQHRMLRQQIIGGFSRFQMSLFYFFVCFWLSLFSCIAVFCLSFLFSDSSDVYWTLDTLKIYGLFFVQTMGYFSFALMLGIFLKSSMTVIMAFLSWTILLEYVAGYIIQHKVSEALSGYLPFKIFGSLVPYPSFSDSADAVFQMPWENLSISVAYITLFSFLGWVKLHFSDL